MNVLKPTGKCWCGCGGETRPGAFFLPGHDKTAESAVILIEYGSVPQFLLAHGYGPDGQNPREALDRHQRRSPWKYAPLADYLARQTDDGVTLTFPAIEAMLGAPLPPSARAHRPWWANSREGHPHARAWLDAGRHTTEVDLAQESVTFTMAEREGRDRKTT